MLVKVNDKATSAFMQQIRRRLSILERPLVTARGKEKAIYMLILTLSMPNML